MILLNLLKILISEIVNHTKDFSQSTNYAVIFLFKSIIIKFLSFLLIKNKIYWVIIF